MEKYKEQIEYFAALGAFLVPFYLWSELYYIIKTKDYSYVHWLKLIISAIVIIASYYYLNVVQRYFELWMVLSTVVIVSVVVGVSKLFKYPI